MNAPANGCGGCTLCCTLMKVDMAPVAVVVKPARDACVHCTGRGCAIYDGRPKACREWGCVWLLSQEDLALRLPAALRPDRSGVVLEINSMGYLVAHCQTPAAWKRDPMRRWLIGRTRHTKVMIYPGPDAVELLKPDGSTEPLRFAGIDPATNERLYRRAEGKQSNVA